jgi:hypothetical protein
MTRLLIVALVACGSRSNAPTVEPAPATEAPPPGPSDGFPRLVPAEAYLRAYLGWFGGLAPEAIAKRAGRDQFDRWVDYLAVIGIPDYQADVPRATQSNALMLAAEGRLAEVLCTRAIEHDVRKQVSIERRLIFAFELREAPARADFAIGLDVLHRTFLSYPIALAPAERVDRFFQLFTDVAARARTRSDATLSPTEVGWVAICAALAQHPEAKLY